ncbi:MAG: aspartate aminotransferase family protein [Acidobacteria bacterium]|nr:MAG: aspartate aminotransferase family protein [Acidobacteriota bacterium]
MTVDIQKIIKADQDYLVHPLYHPNDAKEPFVWVKGEGAKLRTADGREFIDGLACLWNVTLGHGRKELAQAAARQMEQVAFASAYTGHTNIPAVQLAEKLAQRCYPSINHFFFASGGGEANDSAIKTARFFWITQGRPEKTKIISREHAYHGVTMGAMSATGIPSYWPMFGGKLPGFIHIPSPYPYRFVSDNPSVSQGRVAADHLEKAILREGADTVAAFIAEPVQGAGGLIVPQDDYFPRIREICNKYDVLFVADEVITGFGRTGTWFGLEKWGVEPDMISFAKGITSGYLPLGGIGLSDRVYKVMAEAPPDRRWMHAFTYSAHPTCCAVGVATMDILEREGLVEEAARKGKRLLDGLMQLSSLENVGDVRGRGLMCGVELVEDKATKKAFPASMKFGPRVLKECYKRGLVSRIKDDIYLLAPPFVISDADIDRSVSILGEAISAARAN